MVTKTEKNEVFKQMVPGRHADCSGCCYNYCGCSYVMCWMVHLGVVGEEEEP